MAAVKVAARASEMMVEMPSAAVGGGGQWSAVLVFGCWLVAAEEEMAAAETASAMVEAASVMEVAAAAAVMTRRSRQGGLVGRHGAPSFAPQRSFVCTLRCRSAQFYFLPTPGATVLHAARKNEWG